MGTELDNRKLEAEIRKLEAEAQELHQRRRWSGFADAVKIVGGAVAALIGLWAAATTYQITQLQARLALTEKRDADRERAAAIRARDAAVLARARAEAQTNAAERDLAAAQAKIQTAQAELAKIEEQRKPVDIRPALERVSGNLDAAVKSTSRLIPEVLIVAGTEDQALDLIRIADTVSASGFGVSLSGLPQDANVAPAITQVRYFRPEDEAEGHRLTKAITLSRAPAIRSVQLKYVRESQKRRPRSFEVRLAPDLSK